jgi:hypothetical protein
MEEVGIFFLIKENVGNVSSVFKELPYANPILF